MRKYLILILLILPINIYAYSLYCDDNISYGESFNCRITGDNEVTYDEFTGELTTPDSSKFGCVFESAATGLENIGSDGNRFSLKGKPEDSILVRFKCDLKVQPTENIKSQVFVNNFKYHVLDSNNDTKNEVLRSNSITINKYVDDSEPEPEAKPRKTDNPNTRLKSISDDNLKFTFSSFKTEYDIEVLFEVETLNLKVVPNVEGATYEIKGNQTLEIGDNVIDIYVTSPDGESKTCYTLNVKRLKRGEEVYYIEKDSSLSSLEVSGYQLNFEPIILDYTITINYDVSQISVFAKPKNEKANVEVSNSDNLKNGSTVTVTVKSEDGSSTTTYLLHIKKNKEPIDYKTIAIVSALVIAIGGVTILIIKTNQKNREDPLLRLRHDKRKINKGEDFNDAQVPNSYLNVPTPTQPSEPVQQPIAPQVQEQTQVVQTTPQVVQVPVQQVQTSVTPVTPVAPTTPQPVNMPQPVVPETPQPVPMETPVVPATPAPVEPIQPTDATDNNTVNQ